MYDEIWRDKARYVCALRARARGAYLHIKAFPLFYVLDLHLFELKEQRGTEKGNSVHGKGGEGVSDGDGAGGALAVAAAAAAASATARWRWRCGG